jgi:MoxR-like ATPase
LGVSGEVAEAVDFLRVHHVPDEGELGLKYPHLENRRKMVRLLRDARAEVQQRFGETTLDLRYISGEWAKLEVNRTDQDLAKDLGISAAEAIGLLRELDGHEIDLRWDHGAEVAGAGIVTLVRITPEGRAAIGDVPDPNAKLLAALDELAEAIAEAQDVDPDDKQEAKEATSRLRRVLYRLGPDITVEVFSRIAT